MASPHPIMDRRVSVWADELDFDKICQRFPELLLNLPCAAKGGGDNDDRSAPTSICHILDNISLWNRVFWHIGLQLREIRGPGRLSLLRVDYWGKGGCRLLAQSHDARILFHVLLVQHACVEAAYVDDHLIEGSRLAEYRMWVVSALQKNRSLRTLIIGGHFNEYMSIRDGVFEAVASMTNLRKLDVRGSVLTPHVLLDAICPLLVDTTSLDTLSIPGLVLNESSVWRLIEALCRNCTVRNLFVHVSIVHSYMLDGVSMFSRFLDNCQPLSSLSVEGVDSGPQSTYEDLKCIISPLVHRGDLQELRLSGFLLHAECATLLAVLVSRKGGRLRSLDISGCSWRGKSSPGRRQDSASTHGEWPCHPTFTEPSCPWLGSFDSTAQVELSFLALRFSGLRPEDLRALFNTARKVESLRVISLKGVSLCDLKQVYRIIRETSMISRVRLEDTYLVDYSALSEFQEFPEALSKVGVVPLAAPSSMAFGEMVRVACVWHRVTLLNLGLTQNVLSDVHALNSLTQYLSTTALLRELRLVGCGEPLLDSTERSRNFWHSVLLEVAFKNAGIRTLWLIGLRLGKANLRFLVRELAASVTLSEFAFESGDPPENNAFLQLLVASFCNNKTITDLLVFQATDDVNEKWIVIEDVIGRNMGRLTCAAHSLVHKDRRPRCVAALSAVSNTPALLKKVDELTNVDNDKGCIGNNLE
ncbi:hypothetical protein HPB50_014782 [Hyalomma asiaticum]|uniref:Uncharacterized protein n=1 Tax=Hyalomma asiaticum TaxID=266040 RepID=A0ACB7TII5_HYAAI|nr:hypothetical protein HPB50_014782 [Hyalomma asiaticum]